MKRYFRKLFRSKTAEHIRIMHEDIACSFEIITHQLSFIIKNQETMINILDELNAKNAENTPAETQTAGSGDTSSDTGVTNNQEDEDNT